MLKKIGTLPGTKMENQTKNLKENFLRNEFTSIKLPTCENFEIYGLCVLDKRINLSSTSSALSFTCKESFTIWNFCQILWYKNIRMWNMNRKRTWGNLEWIKTKKQVSESDSLRDCHVYECWKISAFERAMIISIMLIKVVQSASLLIWPKEQEHVSSFRFKLNAKGQAKSSVGNKVLCNDYLHYPFPPSVWVPLLSSSLLVHFFNLLLSPQKSPFIFLSNTYESRIFVSLLKFERIWFWYT